MPVAAYAAEPAGTWDRSTVDRPFRLVFASLSVSRGSRDGDGALVPLMGSCGLTCVSYKELTKCAVAWSAGSQEWGNGEYGASCRSGGSRGDPSYSCHRWRRLLAVAGVVAQVAVPAVPAVRRVVADRGQYQAAVRKVSAVQRDRAPAAPGGAGVAGRWAPGGNDGRDSSFRMKCQRACAFLALSRILPGGRVLGGKWGTGGRECQGRGGDLSRHGLRSSRPRSGYGLSVIPSRATGCCGDGAECWRWPWSSRSGSRPRECSSSVGSRCARTHRQVRLLRRGQPHRRRPGRVRPCALVLRPRARWDRPAPWGFR